jgi:hypothetical protein
LAEFIELAVAPSHGKLGGETTMDETRTFGSNSLLGALRVAAALLTAPLSRLWFNAAGATDDEVKRSLPGDDLVADPKLGYTRAITIDAPPESVWPWLAQIGQGRGGLYSYDALENLVGCDLHSADQILPEHQHLEVGDKIRFGPEDKQMPGQVVAAVDPGRALVMFGLNPKTGEADHNATWTFVLEEPAPGQTRLIARQRLTYEGIGASILWHIVEPLNFVMEAEMMRGIRRRAEHFDPDPEGEEP